jgi:hypothetical protein
MAKSKSIFFEVLLWFLQIGLWVLIGWNFYAISHRQEIYGNRFPTHLLIFVIMIYIFYVVLNFASPIASYLSNKHKSDSIHDFIKKMCTGAPGLKWDLECYHYYYTGRKKTKKHKSVTYRESRNFQFFTWRDISGLFLLDSHKVFRSLMKSFIKLELNLEIEFADDITKLDYQMQKDSFYNMNKNRDTHCSITETKELQDFDKFYFIKITDKSPCGVNYSLFVLFTVFIPIVEFYKIYINCFCVEQDFDIKKVVSTRYNLNEQTHAQPWLHRQPSVSVFNQAQVVFGDAPQPCLGSPELPSEDELQRAKLFSNNRTQITGNIGEEYVPHFTPDLNQPQNIKNSDNSNLNVENVNLQITDVDKNRLDEKLI